MSPRGAVAPAVSRATGAARALSVAAAASLGAMLVLPIVALLTFAPLSSLVNAARDPQFRDALGFTLAATGMATGIALALGVPLGYLLARRSFRAKPFVEAVVTLPTLVPHLLVGIALVILFDPSTFFGAALTRLGIPILGTVYGAVAVLTFVSASYAVTASQIAFERVDPTVLEVARTLGASPPTAFRTVTLPIAVRGIVTGGLLAWGRGVSEVGGLLIIAYTIYPVPPFGGPVTNPASVYIYQVYTIFGLPAAAPLGALLILVGFAVFVGVRLLERVGRAVWWRTEARA
ncbi:MAG TPA: ABC transporter permease [Thermoplasmata archaeon]|nr:ABC transporter permease [Thermoplasmata archaeon]